MSIESILLGQKQSVAGILQYMLVKPRGSIASDLERDLGTQSCYDHREVDQATLISTWEKLPTIESLWGEQVFDWKNSIETFSYAFRLTLLGHLSSLIREEEGAKYIQLLSELGVGSQEVTDYTQDFLRSGT